MKNLKDYKCPVANNIGPKLVEKSAAVLSESLAYLGNLYLSAGRVPDELK
jgi:hypothetical protein